MGNIFIYSLQKSDFPKIFLNVRKTLLEIFRVAEVFDGHLISKITEFMLSTDLCIEFSNWDFILTIKLFTCKEILAKRIR